MPLFYPGTALVLVCRVRLTNTSMGVSGTDPGVKIPSPDSKDLFLGAAA